MAKATPISFAKKEETENYLHSWPDSYKEKGKEILEKNQRRRVRRKGKKRGRGRKLRYFV